MHPAEAQPLPLRYQMAVGFPDAHIQVHSKAIERPKEGKTVDFPTTFATRIAIFSAA
jgi:hypothetical protein